MNEWILCRFYWMNIGFEFLTGQFGAQLKLHIELISSFFTFIHSFVQSPSLDTLRANRINLSSHFTFLNYDGQRSQWWIYMKHKLYNNLNYMLIVRLAHAFHHHQHHQHHNCIYLIWMFLLPLFIALHCMHFFSLFLLLRLLRYDISCA